MHAAMLTRPRARALAVLAGAAAVVSVLPAAGCGRTPAAPRAPVPATRRGPVTYITSRGPRRPPGLSARLVLPSLTMTAGSSMTAQVMVANNTGHAIRVPGCLSLFQVVLTSSSYRPTVAWATCLQWFTIRAGHTRYRVTVLASYSQCSQARPRHGPKACLPGGRMPPLPPGIYQARLFQARPLVQIPPPVTIRVTRRSPVRSR